MGLTTLVATWLSVPKDGLCMLFAILLAYPVAAVYRAFVYKRSRDEQYLYFALTGATIVLYVCRWNMYHNVFSILVAYLLIKYLPGRSESIALAHIIFLGHLLVGYWFTESDKYDMTWTTPQCILTLRLIQLVTDVYDGRQEKDRLNKDFLATRIADSPSLLETFAYAYYPGGALVGPQFPLAKLRQLVGGEMNDPKTNAPRDSVREAFVRLAGGCVYMIIHLLGSRLYPSELMYSDEFLSEPSVLSRFVMCLLWFRFIIARYCAAWMINEGANILSGLGYNGIDAKTGKEKWNGVRDFHVSVFELDYGTGSYLRGFNYNTNQWALRYVFKRLRWLGNKYLSHVTVLAYLALWHGYHLGYFVLFFYEFAVVNAEKELMLCMDRIPGLRAATNTGAGFYAKWLVGKASIMWATAIGFLTFGLIKKERWWPAIKAFYLSPYICFFIVWPLLFHLVLRPALFKKKRPHDGTEAGASASEATTTDSEAVIAGKAGRKPDE